jgi:hypothetical protein
MVIEKELKRLVLDLTKQNHAELDLSGFTIAIDSYEQGTWVSLSTTVYRGGDYIPPSVRHCINDKPLFLRGSLDAELKLFEETFQIKLTYLTKLNCIDCPEFFNVLEDFRWLAGKWRDYIDENDQNDLVYIYKNK